jgi:hypothetical protein
MDEISYPDGLTRDEWLRVIEERRNHFYKYPEDRNQKIWRYMDFTKFVAMLDDQALFFPRVSLLSDSYEGSVSQVTIQNRPRIIENVVNSFKGSIPLDRWSPEFEENIRKCSCQLFIHGAKDYGGQQIGHTLVIGIRMITNQQLCEPYMLPPIKL